MNLESIAQAVVEFVRANREFAPLILGLLAFGESLAFVSLVIPAATILIAVGFVVAAAEISFWQAWLGAVLGECVAGESSPDLQAVSDGMRTGPVHGGSSYNAAIVNADHQWLPLMT